MGLQAIGHDKAAWDATGATIKGNKSNEVGAQVAIKNNAQAAGLTPEQQRISLFFNPAQT